MCHQGASTARYPMCSVRRYAEPAARTWGFVQAYPLTCMALRALNGRSGRHPGAALPLCATPSHGAVHTPMAHMYRRMHARRETSRPAPCHFAHALAHRICEGNGACSLRARPGGSPCAHAQRYTYMLHSYASQHAWNILCAPRAALYGRIAAHCRLQGARLSHARHCDTPRHTQAASDPANFQLRSIRARMPRAYPMPALAICSPLPPPAGRALCVAHSTQPVSFLLNVLVPRRCARLKRCPARFAARKAQPGRRPQPLLLRRTRSPAP